MKPQKEVNLYTLLIGDIPKLGSVYREPYSRHKFIVTSIYKFNEFNEDTGEKRVSLRVKGVPKNNFNQKYWTKKWLKNLEKDNKKINNSK